MIERVKRYIRANDSYYVVEYKSGKCKKFAAPTDKIIQFISEIAPTRQSCNNGELIVYTWE